MNEQNEKQSEWREVDVFDPKTYPRPWKRLFVERKDGFCFYGYFETDGDIVPYLPRHPRVKLCNVRRFRVEEKEVQK